MPQQDFINTLLRRDYQQPVLYERQLATDFVDQLFHFLFVPRLSELDTEEKIRHELHHICNKCALLLFDVFGEEEQAEKVKTNFFEALPGIYQLLLKDAQAILASDPAAVSLEEVLAIYPGFYATAVYRFAHQFYKDGVPLLPRFLSEYAHSKTGIDIHPGAQIGESFCIDHGTGIVIGESAVIGHNVKIYQGVTLGALSVAKDLANKKRHPTIGNHVIIYAGSTILGGDTIIGDNCIIGGNVWLTYSVAPDSLVYHQSKVVVKSKLPLPEPLNFVI